MALHLVQVDAPARSGRAQRLQVADHDRRLVEVNRLDRQPRLPRRQRLGSREQPLAHGAGVEREQLAGVEGQIPDDDLVLECRMRRQRPHDCEATALGGVAARQVHEGPAHAHLVDHGLLPVHLQAMRPQFGLALLDQPRQGDRRAHVGQRVVRGFVRQAVGGGQLFELE